MQPLIDADVLLYEIGYAAETGWQQPGFPPFEYVADMFENRVANICAVVEATQPPIYYLTGKGNFRYEIAKRTPYKERDSLKPYHYKNLKAYVKFFKDYRESVGMEADDLMAIEQTKRNDTIICTRDKDLRAVPGWHYGWELGNQPQYGPQLVNELGEIRLSSDRKSIKGEGILFFWSQCLTGDKVDTIPGLPGCGPVKALEILHGCNTSDGAFKAVLEAYRGIYGDDAGKELLEQGQLLWMTREIDNEGNPILWQLPKLEQDTDLANKFGK